MLASALQHHQAGRLNEAEQIYRQILAMDAGHADSLHLLGMIAYQVQRYEVAVEMIRRAIAIDNDNASYHSNLGNVYQTQGQLDEAVASYVRALALMPDNAGVYFNLGSALQSQDKLDEAIACYERVLAINPDHAKAHYKLGCVLHALGRLDEALARYGKVLELLPGEVEAAFSQALAQLLHGDFTPGWLNFEWRWQSSYQNTPRRTYRQPLWQGEKLASGRLFIWGEQGVGDEIMFAGLIPDVVRTGNRCLLDCDARLKPLFARSFPGVELVSGCDPERNPELDIAAHLPSGSLPGLFRTTSAAFAYTTSPYLIADSQERERFRARYTDGRRRIGLAWHTRNQKTGSYRSIDLSLFAPLFAGNDIRWVSLQYGEHDELEHQAAAAHAPLLVDRSVDQLSNIDLFAAQIAAMDLVITIDNSTAHLAGALGVPVWVLLPSAPDWRWLQTREDSPWYPSMRLFRQTTRGDWCSVVQKIQDAL
jgi:Flp pilus assembly protein TadD